MDINNIKTMFELNIILDDGYESYSYESYSYLDDDFLPVYELRYHQKLVSLPFNQKKYIPLMRKIAEDFGELTKKDG